MFPPDVIYVFNFADKKQRCFAHTQYYTAVFVICKYDFIDNPANFWLFRAFFIHNFAKSISFHPNSRMGFSKSSCKQRCIVLLL